MHLNPHEDGDYIDNDNGVLFLAFYMMLKKKLGKIDQSDLDHSFRAIKSIEVEPGLFARAPNNIQMEAHDNYMGICSLSVLFEFAFAREIVELGTKTGFSYNNRA